MAKKVVALDAGHGLPDPGAVGFVKEYLIAMKMVKLVKALLEDSGVKVVLTRTSDKSLSTATSFSLNKSQDLNKRVKIIDTTDFAVSFHMNAGKGTGYESVVYPASVNDKRVVAFHKAVTDYFKSKGFKDRGIKSSKSSHLGGVAVVDNTKPLVILMELLFVDTKADANFINDTKNQNELAEVIAKAICSAIDVKFTKPAPAENPYKGKKLTVLVNDLNYYTKPSWDKKDVKSTFNKGKVLGQILDKVKVDGYDQYKFKTSYGNIRYITASSKYVSLTNK